MCSFLNRVSICAFLEYANKNMERERGWERKRKRGGGVGGGG